MKIRNGFVSNSSSSSFVVICKGTHDQVEEFLNPVEGSNIIGTTDFLYASYDHNVFSKINFAWLMTDYMDCREQVECQAKILDLIKGKGCSPYYEYVLKGHVAEMGYIDHGRECVNYELFEGDNLANFIFNSESHVRTERR